MSEKKILTGVQQIMLGTVTKKEADAARTLASIREAGYDGIELNGFMIHPTSFLVRMLTKAAGMPVGRGGSLPWEKLVKESGLKVISLHTDLGSLKRDIQAAAREARRFETDRMVITGMYRFDYHDEASMKGLCEDLDRAADQLADQGITLLYHNHNVEFQRLASGRTAYDYLLEHSRVGMEFDSYWPTEAGVNVPDLMRRLGSRMQLWHINDRGSKAEGASMTPILRSDSMELGYGNMDLAGLAKIAKENGVQAVVLESHKNWIDKDPVKSLRLSADFMNREFGA